MASRLSSVASPVKGSTSPPPPLPAPPTSLAVTSARCPGGPASQTSPYPPLQSAASASAASSSSTGAGGCVGGGSNRPPKKKERWLVTRKTWRYMADAGKLLIPEVLRKGKDLKDYSAEDMVQLDETFQRACDRQIEFVLWEGPLVDPRILLARNRIATGAEFFTASLRGRYAEEDELEEEDEEEDLEEELEEEEEELASAAAGASSGGDSSGKQQQQPAGGRARVTRKSLLHPQTNAAEATSEGTAASRRTAGRSTSRSSLDRSLNRGLKGTTDLDESKNARNRRTLAAPATPESAVGAGGPFTTLKSVKGVRRTGSARKSTARMSSFGGFGPSGSSYRPATYGGHFDSKLRRRESSRHGFFPSPYGTGMLPAGAQPDYNFDTYASTLRLMLPVGEKAPDGFHKIGNRNLPMGELPHYIPPSSDSYLQLPSGLILQELPPSYTTDEDRDWYSRRSSSAPDSGVLSPSSQDELDHAGFYEEGGAFVMRGLSRESRERDEERKQTESGIGSGADSIGAASNRDKKVNVYVQTEPFPEEFYRLQEEERKKKEEEDRLVREAEERTQREAEAMEATIMGDSVMRYLKMVRRNSKTADHKKADRFRSMNYDPTLRNIKAKYLVSEDQIKGMKSVEVQVGDPIVTLLKKCQTPIDPSPDPTVLSMRKLSQAASDFSSDSIDVGSSPPRRLSIPLPEEPMVPPSDKERDFFSHLYSGSMAPLESGSVPEDYYHYLESWYRAQKSLQPSSGGGGHMGDAAAAAASALGQSGSSGPSSFASMAPNAQKQQSYQHQMTQLHQLHPLLQAQQLQQLQLQQMHAQHVQQLFQQKQQHHYQQQQQQQQQQQFQQQFQQQQQPQQQQQQQQQQLLQHQQQQQQMQSRQLEQQHHTGIYIPVSALQNLRASLPPLTSAASTASNVSKSNSSLGKSQSFLSSVISSKAFAGLGNLNASGGPSAARILPKKLWRPRSKSQSRPSVSGGSAWTPQVGKVMLASSHGYKI